MMMPMHSRSSLRIPSLAEAAALEPQQIVERIGALASEVQALSQQLDWFKRQLFGPKSERRIIVEGNTQMSLGDKCIGFSGV
jgi:hypothetical protein